MSQIYLADETFACIGPIVVERDSEGKIIEYVPSSGTRKGIDHDLNPYGYGPFCRFRQAKGINKPGVYILTVNNVPVYIGTCANLDGIWGAGGYGKISYAKTQRNGQNTMCRINNQILIKAKAGEDIDLWFKEVRAGQDARLRLRKKLKEELHPSWNLTKNC
jgi:hypothetical protein